MKHLRGILVCSLFIFGVLYVNAQNRINPWAISAGGSVVDMYPVHELPPQGTGYFDELLNIKEHWNIQPYITRIAISRYIIEGFSFKIDGSYNKISKIGDKSVEDWAYFSFNGGINYNFSQLIYNNHQGRLSPYLGIGTGATWLESRVDYTLNAELGFTYWISNRIGVTFGSVIRKAFPKAPNIYSHFQHYAVVKYRFGSNDADQDGVSAKRDNCPDVAGLPEFNGCPDTDHDGVPDKNDDCPNTPGLAKLNGCSDADGDGVPYYKDDCASVAGPKANGGCPWSDIDKDGVIDKKDDCINNAGPASNNGCPLETQKK